MLEINKKYRKQQDMFPYQFWNYWRLKQDYFNVNLQDSDTDIITKDGHKIRINSTGRKELFRSIDRAVKKDFSDAAAYRVKDSINEILGTLEYLNDIIENSKRAPEKDKENKKKWQKSKQERFVQNYEVYQTPIILNGKKRTVTIQIERRMVPRRNKEPVEVRNYYYHYFEQQERPSYVITSFKIE